MTDWKKMTSSKLLWLDLEMTGLDVSKHRIVEVAAIITDWQFAELALFDAVVYQPPHVLKSMDEWPRLQHATSGLSSRISQGMPESQAESELLALANSHFDSTEPVVLAGNSIHMDRQFIRAQMPELEARLHYRMLDVSAWKVVMRGRFGVDYHKREAHRALDDIRESITELQYYLTFMHPPKI